MADARDDTVTREAELLRALCRSEARERSEVVEQLAGYRWQEADHQWIFEALSELGASENRRPDVAAPENLQVGAGPDVRTRGEAPHVAAGGGREELARRLVRRGFPDIDLERIFARAPASGKATQEIADELLARTAGRGGG